MAGFIDDKLRQHIEGPTSVALAAAFRSGHPAVTRDCGTRVESDRVVRVPLLSRRAAWVLAALRDNPRVALTYTQVDSIASYQLKGHVLDVAPVTPEDREAAVKAFEGFGAALRRWDPNRSLANMVAEVDLVARVQIEQVFDQTPGAQAGALVRAGWSGAPTGRPVIPAVQDATPPTASCRHLEHIFDGTTPPLLVTAGGEGTPNVIYLSKVDVIDAEHVVVSRQFFRKTAENLTRNPHAVLQVGDYLTNRMYALELTHVRSEISGPLFDRLGAEIEALATVFGLGNVFRLEAAEVFRIQAERELPGFVCEG